MTTLNEAAALAGGRTGLQISTVFDGHWSTLTVAASCQREPSLGFTTGGKVKLGKP